MFTFFFLTYFEVLINNTHFHYMQLQKIPLYIIVQYDCVYGAIAPKRIENRVVRLDDELENSITDICTM